MSKLIQRAVYLSFAVFCLYLAFKDVETMATGEVVVRFALVPLFLAFFNETFVKGEHNQKVTTITFCLIGLAMAFAGFGFYTLDQALNP